MHQHDPRPIGTPKGRTGIRHSHGELVQPAEPDVLKWRREPSVLIDQHLDPRCLQGADDALGSIPEVVISQHREATHRRVNTTQQRGQPVDLVHVERDEVSAEQQEVGADGSQSVARAPENLRIGRGSRMEIGSKRYGERWKVTSAIQRRYRELNHMQLGGETEPSRETSRTSAPVQEQLDLFGQTPEHLPALPAPLTQGGLLPAMERPIELEGVWPALPDQGRQSMEGAEDRAGRPMRRNASCSEPLSAGIERPPALLCERTVLGRLPRAPQTERRVGKHNPRQRPRLASANRATSAERPCPFGPRTGSVPRLHDFATMKPCQAQGKAASCCQCQAEPCIAQQFTALR